MKNTKSKIFLLAAVMVFACAAWAQLEVKNPHEGPVEVSNDMAVLLKHVDKNFDARERLMEGGRTKWRTQMTKGAINHAFDMPGACEEHLKMDVIAKRLQEMEETEISPRTLVVLYPGKKLQASLKTLLHDPNKSADVFIWADMAYVEACSVLSAVPVANPPQEEKDFAQLYMQRAQWLAGLSDKNFKVALKGARARLEEF